MPAQLVSLSLHLIVQVASCTKRDLIPEASPALGSQELDPRERGFRYLFPLHHHYVEVTLSWIMEIVSWRKKRLLRPPSAFHTSTQSRAASPRVEGTGARDCDGMGAHTRLLGPLSARGRMPPAVALRARGSDCAPLPAPCPVPW